MRSEGLSESMHSLFGVVRLVSETLRAELRQEGGGSTSRFATLTLLAQTEWSLWNRFLNTPFIEHICGDSSAFVDFENRVRLPLEKAAQERWSKLDLNPDNFPFDHGLAGLLSEVVRSHITITHRVGLPVSSWIARYRRSPQMKAAFTASRAARTEFLIECRAMILAWRTLLRIERVFDSILRSPTREFIQLCRYEKPGYDLVCSESRRVMVDLAHSAAAKSSRRVA